MARSVRCLFLGMLVAYVCSLAAADLKPTPATAVVLVDINGTLCRTQKVAAVTTWLRNAPMIIARFWKMKDYYPSYSDAFKDASAVAASCQDVMGPVETMVRALKRQGFPVYMFTGALPDTVEQLQKKYPDCFGLFDGIIGIGPGSDWKDKRYHEFFAYAERYLERQGYSVSGTTPAQQIYFLMMRSRLLSVRVNGAGMPLQQVRQSNS